MMLAILKAILVGLFVSVTCTISIVFLERKSGIRDSLWEILKEFLVLFLLAAILMLIAELVIPYSTDLDETFDRYPARVIAGGIASAATLFWVRKKRRDVYGFIEIFIALAVLYTFAVNPFSGLIAFIVGFATPVYIVIRGLDNIDQFRSAKKKKASTRV